MSDLLKTALKVGSSLAGSVLGPIGAVAAPVLGSIGSNVLSGFNQRAARKWEEDMYNQYNSPSALVRQYQDAGINPALMFGGQTPAAPTDTSAAPVAESNTGTVTEMLAQLMQLDMLESEKRIKRASANKLEKEVEGQDIENKYRPQILEQTLKKGEIDIEQARYGIAESIARINNIEAQTLNEEERGYLMRAQRLLATAQSVLAGKEGRLYDANAIEREFKNKVLKDTGSEPGTPIWNLLPGVATRAGEETNKFLNWLKKNSVFGYGQYYGK